MKLKPCGEIIGLVLPPEITLSRRRIACAIEDDNVVVVEQYFRAWHSWIIRVENDTGLRVERESTLSFAWNCGSSTSARFETACAAYAYARTLFHLRRYALAYVHFGLALEETMQCRSPLPLSASACGEFRLRCLVRAQRLGICEFTLDAGREILPRAIWLEVALREYALFEKAARKEPLSAGESLVATARVVITRRPEFARKALAWKQNPYSIELLELSRGSARSGTFEKLESPKGEFDWGRFTSARTYAA